MIAIVKFWELFEKSAYLVRTDAMFKVLYCNELYCQFKGKEIQNILGKKHISDDFLLEKLKDKLPVNDKTILFAGSGLPVTLDSIVIPLFAQNGELEEILFLHQETMPSQDTHLLDKFSNLDVKQSFAAIVKALDESTMITFCDDKGQIVWVNDHFLNLTSSKMEQLIDKNIFASIAGNNSTKLSNQILALVRSGTTWQGDLKYRLNDGKLIWLNTLLIPILDNGHLKKIISIQRDITQQVRNELIQREISWLRGRFIQLSSDRNKFFQSLLNKLIEMTESEYGFIGEVLENDEGKYLRTFWLTDISWDESTKKFYEENAPKGFIFKNLNTLFGEVIKTGQPLVTNNPQNHHVSSGLPDGHPPLESIMGLPIYYADKFMAMVGLANGKSPFTEEMIHEFSPFTHAIGEMIHAFRREDEFSHQKHMNIHHSKLASLGQLAAGVGHEINNPLFVISGYLEIALDTLNHKGVLDDEMRSMFSKMENASNRIGSIVKGLRTFARSDEITMGNIDLHQLVKETRQMLSDLYRNDGVVLNYDGEAKARTIFGNRGRIQQVLINLISNAKDATKGRNERIIDLHLESHHDHILLTVSDNGQGIPDEIGDRIFDPFYTTKEVNEGTGIGLSLVNSIIKEHEGKIEFKSKVGVGTKFIISFPTRNNVSLPKEDEAPKKVDQDSLGKYESVLLIEDENEVREILKKFVKDVFKNVFIASKPSVALEILKNEKIDLVISDIKMPEKDGVRFYKEILLDTSKSHPPFIFISGGINLEADHLKFFQENEIEFISKPFFREILLEKISRAISHH